MLTTSHRPRLRPALTVLGTSVLLVAGLHVAADAGRAAKPLLLGAHNKASKTTKLSSKRGPALSLKTKKGPALAVSSTDVVTNLNADLLDGRSLDSVAPTLQTFTIGTAGAHGAGTQQFFQTTALPAGQYEMEMSGTLAQGTAASFCELFDATKLVANPSDYSAIYLLDTTTGDTAESLTDRNVAPVIQGHRLVFSCSIDAGTVYGHPILFTLRRVDDVSAVPSVAPTVVSRAAARALARAAR